MATVNLGSIKFKWKGTYSGATAYTVDDVVEYNGSSYICILASTGNLPTNATYFEQMSSAGTNGTNGTDLTTTLTTQGDLVYRDGSGLQRLGAGTSGYFLKTQGAGANPTWAEAGGKFESALMHVYSGNSSFSSGGWNTVPMSNVATNEISGATLSGNEISLPAGTYFSISYIPFYRVDDYGTRVFNSTNNTTLVSGTQGHTWSPPNDASSPMSIAVGRFTLSTTSNVRIDYYIASSHAQAGAYTGVSNVWTFWKIA
jgi:hypothetical protein